MEDALGCAAAAGDGERRGVVVGSGELGAVGDEAGEAEVVEGLVLQPLARSDERDLLGDVSTVGSDDETNVSRSLRPAVGSRTRIFVPSMIPVRPSAPRYSTTSLTARSRTSGATVYPR
ncbi:hypothetical protein [Streptomyces sp. NPDC048277]|uniref:hypothetical protein n=1 Tax=Streptomyces sp. NPDC048277 TaxID=3155027 RepID=UPI0033EE4AD3